MGIIDTPIKLPNGMTFKMMGKESEQFCSQFDWQVEGMNDRVFCFRCSILSGEYKGEILDDELVMNLLKNDPDFFVFILQNSIIQLP